MPPPLLHPSAAWASWPAPTSLRRALLWRLMVLMVGVLLLVSALVLTLGIVPMAQRQADTTFTAAAHRVAASLDSIQASTQRTLRAGQRWWQWQQPKVDEPQAFNDFFMPWLVADPLITSVVAGTPQGEGWLLLQLPEGRWRNRLTDVPRWGTTQRIVRHEPDGRITMESITQDYDPRLRPWYQVAMALAPGDQVGWTAPYTFFTTGDPGITAAIRLANNQGDTVGVLGLDLMLRDLSDVTLSTHLGPKGMALVLTQDERVLALPKAPLSAEPASWARLLLRPASALELPEIDALIEHWWASHGHAFNVEPISVRGERWLASATPYTLGHERLWIMTLAPAANFSPNWMALIGGMLGLIALLALIVWWLAQVQANRIVRPLEELAQQSERIGQLDFEPPPQSIATPVREIRQLSDVHDHMRQLLLQHQTELEVRIAALENAQREIHRLAYYDPLTQLPNRRLLMTSLGQALTHSQRSGQPGAALFIDLDNFKALNDTLGHSAGDVLLQQVAQRLLACVRSQDTVARLGGDEFFIVLEGLGDAVAAPALVLHPTVMPLSNDTNHTNHINPVADPGTPSATTPTQQVYEVVERVLTELGQPFMIKTTETISTPSIGVVLFYGHERPDDVLKWADMAMYQAKADGRNGVRFFDPVFQTMAEYKAQLELDLRHALRASQFQMWLQPQFDRQRRVVGAEALLRWHHPTRGFIGPTEFIPVAESSGLIVPLGHWVLVQACAQLQQWATQAPTAHWTLSVNVSARQFRHPDFVSQTLALIDQTGIRPQQLRLELTESMLLDDVSHTIERMGLLRQRGVGFSLDDFGTGYSSLAYLKQLPFVELKIDKSFVRDLLTDPNDAVLTQTMIVLAHALGLSVLAEGVETEGQFAALSMDGCDLFQGYLLGKPMPVNEFDQRWS